MKGKRASGKVGLIVGAGAVIFLALTIFGRAGEVERAFARFHWGYLPWILALSLGNYLVRFVRWQYYLGKLGVALGVGRSLTVFIGGLTMSVTPAKLGEFLKSYLLWERERIPVGVTAPVVFAERVTDSTAIILLCVTGVGLFQYQWEIGASMLGIMALFGALVAFRKRVVEWFSRRFMPVPQGDSDNQAREKMRQAAQEVLRPRMVAVGTAIGAVAWFLECVGLYLVIEGFGGETQVTLVAATFVYAFSTFAGAVALIPGGLGVTEGSIAGLLIGLGIARSIAVSATILVRVCTLWFAVGLGAAFLLGAGRRSALGGNQHLESP